MTTIKDLKFDDKNFNKHTEYGMSLLEKSLRENGAGRSILLDKDNNIIAGNGIVEAAGQIGLEKVKIVEAKGDEIIAVKRTDVSLNSHKGREMALADNATAAVDLDWDDEAIKSEFTEEETKGWGVDLDWKDVEEITEDEAPEVDESIESDSKLGVVYQLGRHRLMCGDSTDAESVAILMDGQKAEITLTDPPYNTTGVYWDIKLPLDTMFSIMKANSNRQLIFGVDPFTSNLITTAEKDFVEKIVWVKHKAANFASSSKRLMKYYEEIVVFGKNGIFHPIMVDRESTRIADAQRNKSKHIVTRRYDESETVSANNESFINNIKQWGDYDANKKLLGNVWEIPAVTPNSKERTIHPTQKPLKLLNNILLIYSDGDSLVLDLFGGSGSTLIACEQLGRKCFMMELDPKYCDVIRKRYWKFKTGSEEGWQDGTKAIREA